MSQTKRPLTTEQVAVAFAKMVVEQRRREAVPLPKSWSAKKTMRRARKAMDAGKLPFRSGDMPIEKHGVIEKKLEKIGWQLEKKWRELQNKHCLAYKDPTWPPSYLRSLYISPCGKYKACVQTQSHRPARTYLTVTRRMDDGEDQATT